MGHSMKAWRVAGVVLALLAAAGPAAAKTCAPEELAAAVDKAGAALRKFNAEAQPALDSRIEKLRTKNGWSSEEAAEKSLGLLEDKRLMALDQKSNDLLTRIDTLGRAPASGDTDCGALADIEKAGADLLGVMKEKSAYTVAKLDEELGIKAPAAPPPRDIAPPAAVKPTPWQTSEPQSPHPEPPPAAPLTLPADAFTPDVADEGYSIEEIRDATKGFFGTISTNLATVLEHAFSVAGRPTAYVLGNEGGGAFLAGLRYGSGTLFMRQGGKSKVYWHGPSIGTDFGAEGSRTLFLIYKLHDPEKLFRAYTGVDGSAYLVGGIGFTLMKGGPVFLAPIRSGIGLRFGANIGYVRFTPNATWNPF